MNGALTRAGWRTDVSAGQGPYASAVVFLARARAAQRAQVAEAARLLPARASLWVDGQKSDGIETMLRDLRGLATVDPLISKAHGKLFRVTIPEGPWLPDDWTATEAQVADGFVTRPGVFSADGPDPASLLLAQALPPRLPTRMVDLGAGWGWLAAQVLAREGVDVLHLVEADHDALTCARRNVSDPRAQFHWADALAFRLPEPVNGVVMNPPFHGPGGNADPRLGAGFIRAAAGLLTGAGRLWMVANRHLPYEAELASHFRQVEEIGGNGAFKVITASGARRS
ncbi:class I SAM-dependent methyltransferase [Paracoccus suum]|uniref:Class I SAM-dependent methyltransferase n=2 Tax=Paracoccus suum TaxID=2259340 RepID=A0A344PPA5_9RHOB|nr:class I SAM-dependent methyltransferase [Paracoccus suum]